MLEWCSYCQRFMGESAPYENFAITHGCCAKCISQHGNLFTDHVVEHAQFLRGIFDDLLHAGRHNDFSAGMRTIEKAIATEDVGEQTLMRGLDTAFPFFVWGCPGL